LHLKKQRLETGFSLDRFNGGNRVLSSYGSTAFNVYSPTEMLKNVVRHSVATALASMVFPVPGGPYSRIPLQGNNNPVHRVAITPGCHSIGYMDILAVMCFDCVLTAEITR
jgi:hypothetical protein